MGTFEDVARVIVGKGISFHEEGKLIPFKIPEAVDSETKIRDRLEEFFQTYSQHWYNSSTYLLNLQKACYNALPILFQISTKNAPQLSQHKKYYDLYFNIINNPEKLNKDLKNIIEEFKKLEGNLSNHTDLESFVLEMMLYSRLVYTLCSQTYTTSGPIGSILQASQAIFGTPLTYSLEGETEKPSTLIKVVFLKKR